MEPQIIAYPIGYRVTRRLHRNMQCVGRFQINRFIIRRQWDLKCDYEYTSREGDRTTHIRYVVLQLYRFKLSF